MKQKNGKFIVIDGPDGTGKATQTAKTVENLIKKGFNVEKTDFPQYYNNFFGKIIGQCQKDESLEFSKVNPYIASILYAGDRFESKTQILSWLEEGKIVVSDRYVSANQLHQGGKISDEKERRNFFSFLHKLEYETFSIPKPDLVIYLELPHAISVKLMEKQDSAEKRKYSGGKIDSVEKDSTYQLNARDSAITMLTDDTWCKISCSDDGETILTIDDINSKIMKAIEERLF